jgi:hypothetical protein
MFSWFPAFFPIAVRYCRSRPDYIRVHIKCADTDARNGWPARDTEHVASVGQGPRVVRYLVICFCGDAVSLIHTDVQVRVGGDRAAADTDPQPEGPQLLDRPVNIRSTGAVEKQSK